MLQRKSKLEGQEHLASDRIPLDREQPVTHFGDQWDIRNPERELTVKLFPGHQLKKTVL